MAERQRFFIACFSVPLHSGKRFTVSNLHYAERQAVATCPSTYRFEPQPSLTAVELWTILSTCPNLIKDDGRVRMVKVIMESSNLSRHFVEIPGTSTPTLPSKEEACLSGQA
jgi:hypothetical protein